MFPKQVANLVSQHHSISNHWLNNEREVALPWVLQQTACKQHKPGPTALPSFTSAQKTKRKYGLKGKALYR